MFNENQKRLLDLHSHAANLRLESFKPPIEFCGVGYVVCIAFVAATFAAARVGRTSPTVAVDPSTQRNVEEFRLVRAEIPAVEGQFSTTVPVDIGECDVGQQVKISVVLTNESGQDLKNLSLHAKCACSKATLSKKEMLVGENAKLDLVIDTAKNSREVIQSYELEMKSDAELKHFIFFFKTKLRSVLAFRDSEFLVNATHAFESTWAAVFARKRTNLSIFPSRCRVISS